MLHQIKINRTLQPWGNKSWEQIPSPGIPVDSRCLASSPARITTRRHRKSGLGKLVTVGCRWLPMSWVPGLWQMSSRKGYSKGNRAHSHWSLSCGGGDHPMGPGVEIELGLVPPIEKVNDSADQRIGNPTTGCGAHWLNVVDPEVSHSRLSC